DDFAIEGPKGSTKRVAAALAALGVSQPTHKVLIVDGKTNANLVRGARNLRSSQWVAPEGVNVYDVLRHEALILTQSAVATITAALTTAGASAAEAPEAQGAE